MTSMHLLSPMRIATALQLGAATIDVPFGLGRWQSTTPPSQALDAEWHLAAATVQSHLADSL